MLPFWIINSMTPYPFQQENVFLLLYEHIDPTRRLNRTNSYTLLQEMVPTLGTGVRAWPAQKRVGYRLVGLITYGVNLRVLTFLKWWDGSVEIQMGFLPFSGLEAAISYGGQDSGELV